MFLILKAVYFTTYTDDDSLFVGTDNIKDVIQSLQEVSESLITWFSENQMNLNPDKCHQLLNTKEQTTLKNLHIKNSWCAKLLGINSYYKLNFV